MAGAPSPRAPQKAPSARPRLARERRARRSNRIWRPSEGAVVHARGPRTPAQPYRASDKRAAATLAAGPTGGTTPRRSEQLSPRL
eukprot:8251786-Alexandrium_andersonii.AAC.1